MGVDGITLGNIRNAIIFGNAPSPVLIGIFATSSTRVLNVNLQVANKQKSTSTVLVGQTQNWTLLWESGGSDASSDAETEEDEGEHAPLTV